VIVRRRLGAAWRRLVEFLTPPRTIRPTRDGWWCLGAAVGLGFAAMNTGNNLLYLLASLLLALIVMSGVFSEQSMRRLRLAAVVPDEIYAGRPTLAGARVINRKRWLPSYSVTLEAGGRRLYLDRLGAGEERLVTWETTLPRRGRHRLPGLRVTTRFPFGLFVKASRLILDQEVVVFPAVHPLDAERRRALAASGARASRRRGRGHDLYNLREYRPGDDRRTIHWRSSAKAGSLVVREHEADTSTDARIVLVGDGAGAAGRREAALAEAASLAAHLLQAGGTVELVGPGLQVAPGRGRAHRARVLTALALWEPGAPAAPVGPPAAGVGEIRVALG
jgi:uncharacterized protein (DUF58 family)